MSSAARPPTAAIRSTDRSSGWPGKLPRPSRRGRRPIARSGSTTRRPPAPGQSRRGEIEPLYGKTYLPRKFKVGLGLPGDNCADVYCQDVGLLAVCRNYDVIGYNVLVGGGMGMTPAKPNTFPALAQRMAYARADQILDLLRAIVGVFRDFGNRSDRKRARLKYLIADWGLAAFQEAGRTMPGLRTAAARARRSLGHRRPPRLARAGRRPLVLRHARAQRTHSRHGRGAAEIGLARYLRKPLARPSA